ncbi:hypothetical protein A2699_02030 [Candidatus Gottesmanbacteria bacterium RIFCSPHIGHO2_01_FULL_43_15]|nr:MAG: hypothetical protein A2699_02030 [Candidatus Gottesmanbacteria bacterium RIFCSPHIGHO2_01_FULL_43_15]
MRRYHLNKEQKKFLSDFLNSLSVAWFSAGVISPFFIKVNDVLQLGMQVSGSVAISATLFLIGLKNLSTRK